MATFLPGASRRGTPSTSSSVHPALHAARRREDRPRAEAPANNDGHPDFDASEEFRSSCAPTTVEALWAIASERPSHPAVGLVWEEGTGTVGCGIQLEDGVGAVVLDFPADRLIAAIEARARDDGWRIAGREARWAGDDHGAIRYILTLERRRRVAG